MTATTALAGLAATLVTGATSGAMRGVVAAPTDGRLAPLPLPLSVAQAPRRCSPRSRCVPPCCCSSRCWPRRRGWSVRCWDAGGGWRRSGRAVRCASSSSPAPAPSARGAPGVGAPRVNGRTYIASQGELVRERDWPATEPSVPMSADGRGAAAETRRAARADRRRYRLGEDGQRAPLAARPDPRRRRRARSSPTPRATRASSPICARARAWRGVRSCSLIRAIRARTGGTRCGARTPARSSAAWWRRSSRRRATPATTPTCCRSTSASSPKDYAPRGLWPASLPLLLHAAQLHAYDQLLGHVRASE